MVYAKTEKPVHVQCLLYTPLLLLCCHFTMRNLVRQIIIKKGCKCIVMCGRVGVSLGYLLVRMFFRICCKQMAYTLYGCICASSDYIAD